MLSRRDACILGVGVPLVSLASILLARRSLEDQQPSGGYRTSLVDGYTPKRLDWDGYRWSADMGSTWNAGMDHCFRHSVDMARF